MTGRRPAGLHELAPGFQFRPVAMTVTRRIVHRYAAAIGRGEVPDTVPCGLYPALARTAYLAEQRMPEGSVLLAQEVTARTGVPVGEPLMASARLVERRRMGARVIVVLETRFALGATEVATVESTVALGA